MRWLISLVVLCACGTASSSSSCPTVDELTRGDGRYERRGNEVIVATCRADGWSSGVTRCLREAKDDLAADKCLRLLSPAQEKRLKAAFKPLEAEIGDEHVQAKKVGDEMFRHEIDELHLEALATRAPNCGGFREAVEAVRKATQDTCREQTDQLEMFGARQIVLKDARELMAITDDKALGAACAEKAQAQRDSATKICKR